MISATASSLSGLGQGQRGVGHRVPVDSRKGRISVGLAATGGEDMLDFDSTRGQGVGDQRTMASPGDGFRAHDDGRGHGGRFDELGQTVTKCRGLHVVRVTAKARIFPPGIDGILAGMPEPAESGLMDVPDPMNFQGRRQLILSKLRIAARLGDGADVHELPNAVGFQRLEKLLDGQRGVADGEDHTDCSKVLSFESTS